MNLADLHKPTCEEAFRQVVAHRTMLEAYVQAIIRDPSVADDILSDVILEIVRNWESYDKTRPFAPWARGVARRVAADGLRARGQQPVLLENEVLESIGGQLDAMGNESRLNLRLRALNQCTEHLTGTHRQLIRLRYFENRPYEEIARTVKRSVNALYVAFNRIHEALIDCVHKRLEHV